MSIEEKKVKLSKEEKEAKKARKEAKRAEAAAATPAATTSAAAAVTPAEAIEGVSASDKKEKKNKDKKRKDREEISGEAIIRGEESGAEKQKKNKDDKKKRKVENGEVAQPDPATLAAPTAVEAATLSNPFEAPTGLSKKQQKKLARAAEAEAAAAAAGPSSSEPLIKPEAFTSAHNEYLATNAITLLPQLYPPQLNIAALPISDTLRPFLKKFTNPTPIQACSWPPLLASRDVVGIAETGSGKTLAFGVPGMNRLVDSGKKKKGPHMLVIAPTRELALQSHDTLVALGKEAGVKSICVYGGVGKAEQIFGIKESKIVVGTPGRLLDLADSGDLDLSG
jgi:ATP-dependent RNA helicase DBP3